MDWRRWPAWMKSVWGTLVGPVIAAAVILAPNTMIDGVADSKVLSPKRRQALFAVISEAAIAVDIGEAELEEVDRINVYWAAMEARRRAVEDLAVVPAHVLVDGKRRIAGCGLVQTPVVEGDARSLDRGGIDRGQGDARPAYDRLRAALPWIWFRAPQRLCKHRSRCRIVSARAAIAAPSFRARRSGERAGWNNSFNFGVMCGRKGSRLRNRTGSFDDNRPRTALAVCRTRCPLQSFGAGEKPLALSAQRRHNEGQTWGQDFVP